MSHTTTTATSTIELPIAGLTGATAAIHAELCNEASVTAATLALATGVSPSAARKALVTLEQHGLAHRTPGGNDRTRRLPDLWHPTIHDTAEPTPSTDTAIGEDTPPQLDPQSHTDPEALPEPRNQQTDDPTECPDQEHELPQNEDVANRDDTTNHETTSQDPTAEKPDTTDSSPTTPLPETPSELTTDNVDTAGQDTTPTSALTGAPTSADPNPTTTNTDPTPAPTEPPTTPTDHICTCATCGTQLRPRPRKRTPAPVTTGGPRLLPGELYTMVLDHLRADPTQEWPPAGIANLLGRSAGAIGNALNAMVGRGEAVMTSVRPRRYRAAAPATDSGHSTD
jgi:hypothetical protein